MRPKIANQLDDINYLTIKFLVEEKGFDVNAKDAYSQSLLMRYDDAHSSIDICRALIQNGANVKAADNLGETALHKTARRMNLGMCQLLLEFGADVNAACRYDWRPLHEVCSAMRPNSTSVSLAIVKCLLSHGADVNLKIDDGRTALDLLYAYRYEGYRQIESYLRRYNGKKSEEM